MTKLHLLDEGSERVPSNELSQPKVTPAETSGSSFRQKLMFAASASMMSLAAPISGLYGGRAMAQALPAGCVDTNPADPTNANVGNSIADTDETIECVSNPPGTAIGSVGILAEDLTLNIGDGTTATLVQFDGNYTAAIDAATSTELRINIRENSTVDGAAELGVKAQLNSGTTVLTIDAEGTIEADKQGVSIDQYDGVSNITTKDVTSRANRAIRVFAGADASNIGITSTGDIIGQSDGISVNNIGSGSVTINANNVTGNTGYGIQVSAGNTSDTITVSATGSVTGLYGISLSQLSANDINVNFGTNSLIDGTYSGLILTTSDDASKIAVNGGGASVVGGLYGTRIQALGGDVTVDNLSSISADSYAAVSINSFGGDITVQNIGSVTSELNTAVFVDSKESATDDGGNISIQNLAIPKFDHDNNPGTEDIESYGGIKAYSGTGSINIGFGDPNDDADDAASAIGNVYAQDRGIYASSQGGDININVDGIVETGDYGIQTINTGLNEHKTNLTLGPNSRIKSRTKSGTRLRSYGPESDIELQGQSGEISGFLFGANVRTDGGDITVQNLTLVSGQTRDALVVDSGGGDITIRDIESARTRGSTYGVIDTEDEGIAAQFAIDASSRARSQDPNLGTFTGAGGNISIQNVAVETYVIPVFPLIIYSSNGIKAFSGSGDINIGFGDLNDDADDAANAIGNIYATARGIYVHSQGGDININVDGDIGTGAQAVEVRNDGETGLIDATFASVSSASEKAIQITNQGSGTTELTVEGLVTSETNAITIDVASASGANVTVAETGRVENQSGVTAIEFMDALEDDADNDTFTLLGRIVSGDVIMGGGADRFEYNGILDDGVTVYGGTGADTLALIGTGQTFDSQIGADGAIQDFENLALAGIGNTLSGTHTGWQQVTFETGSSTTLDGQLSSQIGLISAGATLNARDNAVFTGDLTNSGELLIGNSPGIFTVAGNFVQTSSGLLPIEIARTSWDQLKVDGTATLGGTLNLIADLNELPEDMQVFPVVIADLGVTGEFTNITDTLPDVDFGAFVTETDPNTVNVTYIAPVMVKPTPDPDPTPTPDPDPGQNPDPDPEPLLSAKEIGPSGLLSAIFVNDMFVENLIQRRAVQITPDQWSFWTNGFGGKHDVGMANGIPGWDGDTGGLALGVERLISLGGNPVLFGAAGGYTETSIKSDASHADVEGYHLGAFANTDLGALFLAGSLAYSWQDYGFERAIIGPNSATLAFAKTDGTGWALKTEAYYDVFGDAETGTSLGPVATFGSTIVDYDGYKETGAGILNLNWSDEIAYQTVLGLGGEGGVKTDLNGLTFDTGLRVLWESVGGDRDLQTRAFLDVPGAHFKPRAATLDTNRIAVSFDSKLYLTKGLFAHIRYDTTRGENLIDHEGWAGITLRF